MNVKKTMVVVRYAQTLLDLIHVPVRLVTVLPWTSTTVLRHVSKINETEVEVERKTGLCKYKILHSERVLSMRKFVTFCYVHAA